MVNPPFHIVLAPRATRDLKKFDRNILRLLDEAILKLSSQPYPAKMRKIVGRDIAQYRIRVGEYRILYDVDESNKRVVILRVGHRKDIYR